MGTISRKDVAQGWPTQFGYKATLRWPCLRDHAQEVIDRDKIEKKSATYCRPIKLEDERMIHEKKVVPKVFSN